MDREWTLVVTAPCAWITANKLSGTWGRYQAARLTRAWREAVAQHARAEKLPVGLQRVRIEAVARFMGRAPVRDRDNLRPTLKAAIDALGPARTFTRNGKIYHAPGHGLIADDDDKHLAGSDIHIGEPLSTTWLRAGHPGLLILTIWEVTNG